ncbi:MAG: twin-arginine translocation pathway signal protein [Acetobacteraceae bacterium]|nr:twin-arginine translocation pathway signal protein [Acetobacteraceae bacterium]
MKRLLVAAAAAVVAGTIPAPSQAQPAGDPIRPIVLLTQPQAALPQEYQAAELIAAAWKQLGLQVQIRPLPSQQFSQIVWYERQRWDASTWQMVGRPERSDPDELTYNLFLSANIANGYNFVGYKNPEYDKLANAQRQELDLNKRKALIIQLQEMINKDQPYGFMVHPKNVVAFNRAVWDEKSVIDQAGIGARNTWTWLNITPLTAQKDIILNSVSVPTNLNPFNISGAQGSWAAEIVWDRLMRIGPDGLAKPWAASEVTRPDPLTVDVKLRAGMKWSDGQPVTIEDAVFSLVAPGISDKSPMYKPFVANIANVQATGADTLRITLKKPDAAFLVSSLSKLNLAPKHVWEPIFESLKGKPETAESIMEAKPVSSGPFRLTKAKLSEEIVLEANPDHWAKPKAARWIMRIQPNTEAALGALRSGEINFLSDYNGDPQLLRDLAKSDPNIKMAEALDMGFKFIAYNNRRQPFDVAAFRVALSASIDRELLAEDAWGGAAVPSNSWVSPALAFWHDQGIENRVPGGSVEAAKKILKDAGYVLVNGRLHYPAGVKETTPAFQ